MKKMPYLLVPVVLAVAALLLPACSASPEEQLRSQVPAAAEQLAFLDLGTLTAQEPYASAVREGLEELKKGMRKEGLPESLLKSRGILFACAREKWAGAVIRTAKGEARQLYEYMLKKAQEEEKAGNSFLKVRDERGVRSFTAGAKDGSAGGYAILHNENLLTVAMQMGKIDPARFKPGKNELNSRIALKGALVSLAAKFALPDEPAIRQNVEQLYQMVPSLRKLENVFATLPAGEKAEQAEVRLVFADADSATQFKAVLDMGAGVAARNNAEAAKLAVWKTDGKALIVSINIKQAIDAVNNAVQQAQGRAKHVTSLNHLKQLGLGIQIYAGDNSDKCPPDLTALVKEGYLSDTGVLISPKDKVRKAASGKVIAPANTSYVYVGKGLKTAHDSRLPVAFEKPDLLGQDGECAVLFLDGHVESRTVRGRTCRAIAEELMPGNQVPEKAKQTVLDNAAAADRAR